MSLSEPEPLTIDEIVDEEIIEIDTVDREDPEPLTMDKIVAKAIRTYDYVDENTDTFFNGRVYSSVMRLANHDPDKAIEIFNDPDYPEKFLDETGYLPRLKGSESVQDILKRSSDTWSYIKENTNREFAEYEYSSLMRLSNGDPIKAVEIFNDPDYPEKFYDETGSLP